MAKIIINIDMEELKSGVNQLVDDDMTLHSPAVITPGQFGPIKRQSLF